MPSEEAAGRPGQILLQLNAWSGDYWSWYETIIGQVRSRGNQLQSTRGPRTSVGPMAQELALGVAGCSMGILELLIPSVC